MFCPPQNLLQKVECRLHCSLCPPNCRPSGEQARAPRSLRQRGRGGHPQLSKVRSTSFRLAPRCLGRYRCHVSLCKGRRPPTSSSRPGHRFRRCRGIVARPVRTCVRGSSPGRTSVVRYCSSFTLCSYLSHPSHSSRDWAGFPEVTSCTPKQALPL